MIDLKIPFLKEEEAEKMLDIIDRSKLNPWKLQEADGSVTELEFDEDYYPYKGKTHYSTLTEEKIGEIMAEISKNHPMPIVSAMDHDVLKDLVEFKYERPMIPEEMFVKPTDAIPSLKEKGALNEVWISDDEINERARQERQKRYDDSGVYGM